MFESTRIVTQKRNTAFAYASKKYPGYSYVYQINEKTKNGKIRVTCKGCRDTRKRIGGTATTNMVINDKFIYDPDLKEHICIGGEKLKSTKNIVLRSVYNQATSHEDFVKNLEPDAELINCLDSLPCTEHQKRNFARKRAAKKPPKFVAENSTTEHVIFENLDSFYDDGNQLRVRDHAGKLTVQPDVFSYNVDVAGFKPEELKVDIEGDELVVLGDHKEVNPDESVHRHFVRRVKLPHGSCKDAIKCDMDEHGRLTVTGTITQLEDSKMSIPISFRQIQPAVEGEE